MDGAKKLGERLLRDEVLVEGLNELLASLRDLTVNDEGPVSYFNIPELDALLPQPVPTTSTPALTSNQIQDAQYEQIDSDLWHPDPDPHFNQFPPPPPPSKATLVKTPLTGPPIIELISPPPTHSNFSSSGKTSLIYLIVTLAILPPTLHSTPLSGLNAAVVVIDPLARFCVQRLVEVMAERISSALKGDGRDIYEPGKEGKGGEKVADDQVKEVIKEALKHIHIFRPQSFASLLATLESLPSYLFDAARHESMGRRVSSIILEDVDVFYWELRAATTLPTNGLNSNPTNNPTTTTLNLATASTALTNQISYLRTLLSAAFILTFTSPSPSTSTSHSTSFSPSISLRAPIPTTWPPYLHPRITKFAIRRIDVSKFPSGMSAEEAEKERGQRGEVVRRGRFECWRISGGGDGGIGERERRMDDRGRGFVIAVRGGVCVEREDRG